MTTNELTMSRRQFLYRAAAVMASVAIVPRHVLAGTGQQVKTSKKFRHIELRGDARQRGEQHGEALREEIHRAWAWYDGKLFTGSGMSNDELESFGEKMLERIENFNPDYRVEIDATARAAGMKPWQLSVLNSRTELANAPSKECTVLYFQKHCLVGQNWDWFEDALDWTVTCDLERPDGHRIVMLCEAGTLAKQGMNNCGLGLCLNFLVWPNTVEGVPVHILMRAFLDSEDIGEAKAALARAGHGQASHLLLADTDGNHLSVELGNGRVFELQPQNEFIAHTNHYISGDAKAAPHVDGANSRGRLETALRGCARRQQKLDIDAMMSILLDEDHVDTPLCCPFEPLPEVFNFPEGTTATLVMDLPGRKFHVKKGPDRKRDFEVFNV